MQTSVRFYALDSKIELTEKFGEKTEKQSLLMYMHSNYTTVLLLLHKLCVHIFAQFHLLQIEVNVFEKFGKMNEFSATIEQFSLKDDIKRLM